MPSPPAPDFNAIAPVYDALARLVFGTAQRRAQAYFLSAIPQDANVLVLGGGSGWILTYLLQVARPEKVLFLEASSQMLAKARKSISQLPPSSAQVEFRLGTENDLKPEERFHVVLTPFVLDLFTEAEALVIMHKLHQALLPGGLWLHTDFHLSNVPGNRVWQKPLLWTMYRFFRKVSNISGRSLPPVEKHFHHLGLHQQQEASFFGDFIKAQILQK